MSSKEEPAWRARASVMFATRGKKSEMLTGSDRYGAQGDNDRHAHRRRTGAPVRSRGDRTARARIGNYGLVTRLGDRLMVP